MPCMDSGYDNSYSEEYEKAARAACDLARIVREDFPQTWRKMKHNVSPQTLAWIEKHDEEDRKRIKREIEEAERNKQRKDAIAKLTDWEKQLLGIR